MPMGTDTTQRAFTRVRCSLDLIIGCFCEQVIPDVVWPVAKVTEIGIIIASLAQALQCLITAPKLLQVG